MHDKGIVDCPDVDAMEQEMWAYGSEAARRIEDDDFELATLYQARHSRTPTREVANKHAASPQVDLSE